MAGNYTLTIIKPDAFSTAKTGKIIAHLEQQGFRILASRVLHMTQGEAGEFYAVHKERPFYSSLVKFMTSGPVVVSVLEGENAIARNRELMGDTNSAKAAPGTIRARFGADIERNAVHGSDAASTARVEIAYFFNAGEIQGLVEALPG